MSESDFKKWMKENGLDVTDIRSMTKLSEDTIKAYLAGKEVHASTRNHLQMLTRLRSVKSDGDSAA